MSAVAKLRAKLPGNPDINGLDAIAKGKQALPFDQILPDDEDDDE